MKVHNLFLDLEQLVVAFFPAPAVLQNLFKILAQAQRLLIDLKNNPQPQIESTFKEKKKEKRKERKERKCTATFLPCGWSSLRIPSKTSSTVIPVASELVMVAFRSKILAPRMSFISPEIFLSDAILSSIRIFAFVPNSKILTPACWEIPLS